MIVSELKLYDFRKFKSNGNEPGLSITFHTNLVGSHPLSGK